MFNWFKRRIGRNSSGSPMDANDAYYEGYMKKLRKEPPARIYAMATTISNNPDPVEQVASMTKRRDAAMVLQYFPSPETSEVLQRVITTDSEYLVRYHALQSLLVIHGYPQDEKNQHVSELAPKIGTKKPAPPAEVLEAIQQLVNARPMKPATDKK